MTRLGKTLSHRFEESVHKLLSIEQQRQIQRLKGTCVVCIYAETTCNAAQDSTAMGSDMADENIRERRDRISEFEIAVEDHI